MIRHIVMWNFKEDFTNEENIQIAQKIKKELEALPAKIEGIVSLEVNLSPLKSSDRDLFLNSLFTSEAALANYQTHPEHVRVGTYVKTVLTNRTCIDYEE